MENHFTSDALTTEAFMQVILTVKVKYNLNLRLYLRAIPYGLDIRLYIFCANERYLLLTLENKSFFNFSESRPVNV